MPTLEQLPSDPTQAEQSHTGDGTGQRIWKIYQEIPLRGSKLDDG
jgi:hypothetical protein